MHSTKASPEPESPSSPPPMGGAVAPPLSPPTARRPRPEGGSRPRPAHPSPATSAPLPCSQEPAEHSWTQQPPSPAPQQQVGEGSDHDPGASGDPGPLGLSPSSRGPVRGCPRLDLGPAAGASLEKSFLPHLAGLPGDQGELDWGLRAGEEEVQASTHRPRLLQAPELTLTQFARLGLSGPGVTPALACRRSPARGLGGGSAGRVCSADPGLHPGLTPLPALPRR